MSYATPIKPRVYNISVLHGEVETVTFPGTAVFTQIQNLSSTFNISCMMNGDSNATFNLDKNTTQVFNYGDMHLTSLTFDNSLSGATTVDIEIIIGYVG